jgi:hypothetical protein
MVALEARTVYGRSKDEPAVQDDVGVPVSGCRDVVGEDVDGPRFEPHGKQTSEGGGQPRSPRSECSLNSPPVLVSRIECDRSGRIVELDAGDRRPFLRQLASGDLPDRNLLMLR